MVNKNESDLEKGVGIPHSEIRIPQSNALRILLLEDSPTDAELNERVLRKAGIDFTSLRVETRAAFVAALDEFRPDIILADYSLPGFDGLQALDIVRERSPHLPYIFVTGAMGEEQAVEAIKQGAADYILKDRLARLPVAVQHALREKETKISLRNSETRLHTIIENLTEGIAVSDLDGQLLHFNRAALDLHGFATLDECRQHLTKFADTFELSAMDGTLLSLDQWPLARVLRGESLSDLEVYVRHLQAGWQRVYSYGGTLVRDADGQPLMAILTISDITGRKQAEAKILATQAELQRLLDAAKQSHRATLSMVEDQKQAEVALRNSDAQLRTIVENLTEGVAVSDLDGQLLHFNRAALDLYGFATLDECRQHLSKFADTFELSAMDGTLLALDQWPLARVLRGESLSDLEVYVRHLQAGWQRVYSYGGTLVRDADGQPLMAILTISDITGRKQAEAQLIEQLDELRRWHNATSGREGRILILKHEINELLVQAGQPPRYPSAELSNAE